MILNTVLGRTVKKMSFKIFRASDVLIISAIKYGGIDGKNEEDQ